MSSYFDGVLCFRRCLTLYEVTCDCCVKLFLFSPILFQGVRGGAGCLLRHSATSREFRVFDFSIRDFSGDLVLPAALWPYGRLNLEQIWVPLVSSRSKGGRCAGLTTLPPSCTDCLEQGWLTLGTRKDFSWNCWPKFCFCPTSVSVLWRTFVYIWLRRDCIWVTLPLLPNNTAVKHFYTNREQCEVSTGYLSLGRRPGGDRANTWHWAERFTVCLWNRKW